MRRVRGQIAQLERIGLEIVELMRLILAYPANVFVATEAHGAVIDVGDPRERILVAVVLHQESVAPARASAERMRHQRAALHRARDLRARDLHQCRRDIDRKSEGIDAPRRDYTTLR